MKHLKLTILLFSTLFLVGCATIIKLPNTELSVQNILHIPESTQDDLYVKVNSWLVENFNSAEAVVEFSDKEAGKVIGKFTFDYLDGWYIYTARQIIDISIQEDRVRVIIKRPDYKLTRSAVNNKFYDQNYKPLESQKDIDRTKEKWNELIYSLKDYLNKDDSW